jgi:hypothetical protein
MPRKEVTVVGEHLVRKAGDTVWIWPGQHLLSGYPDGFAFFLSIVHGASEPRNPYSDKLLTTGYIFDDHAGGWLREPISMTISKRQPLVSWSQATSEPEAVTAPDLAEEPPDFLEHEGRQYARVRVA